MKPPIHLNRSPFAEDNPEGLHPAPHTPDYRSYRPARGGSRSAALLVLTARVVSVVFTPFYLPVVAFAALFSFSYLHMLPWLTKLWITLVVYCFTVLQSDMSISVTT